MNLFQLSHVVSSESNLLPLCLYWQSTTLLTCLYITSFGVCDNLGSRFYYLHFISEDTEAQRSQVSHVNHSANKWHLQDLSDVPRLQVHVASMAS